MNNNADISAMRLAFIESVRKMRDDLITHMSAIDARSLTATHAEQFDLACLRTEVESLEESLRVHQAYILQGKVNTLRRIV